MRSARFISLLSLLFFALVAGCGQSNLSPKENISGFGLVPISIDWPSQKGAKAMRIPESSVTIEVTVSASDMDTVTARIAYPQTTGTLEVKVGTNRRIAAVARNSAGTIVASGESTGVEIVAGTNPAVSLVLADIEAPATPIGLSTGKTATAITLSWTANSDPDLAGYNVYRSTTSGSGFTKVSSSVVSANSYSDTNVVTDQMYYYRLTAVDSSANESAYTAEISMLFAVSLDIAIILDNTGSMSSAITGTKNSVNAFAASIEATGKNVRFALVTYGDSALHPTPAGTITSERGGAYSDATSERPIMYFGTASSLETVLASVYADGGSDLPENPLDAIKWGYNNLDWESGADKIFIVITDINGHQSVEADTSTDNKCTTTSTEVVTLLSGNAIVYSVSPNYTSSQSPYVDVRVLADGLGEGRTTAAPNTGGKWYQFESSGFDLTTLGLLDDILARY
jgi:fibronectin type 3 domain-containing protein